MTTETITCPHCGKPNDPGELDCAYCRHSLAAAPAGVVRRQLRPTSLSAEPPLVLAQQALRAEPDPAPKVPAAPVGPVSMLSATLSQRMQIYQKLHQMLTAGIPTGMSLNYLEGSVAAPLRPMTRELVGCVQGGGLLSKAMARYPRLFPGWEVAMIAAAEKAGSLHATMGELAHFLELELDLRSQLRVRLLMAKATFFVLILTVLIAVTAPGYFSDLRDAPMGAALAAALAGYLGFVLVRYAAILGIGAIIRLLWGQWARTSRGAQIAQSLSFRIPLFGPMVRNTIRLRFTRALRALWNAGVPPIDALESAVLATGDGRLIRRVADRLQLLGKGTTLSHVLEPLRLFTPEMLYLIQTGETSGNMVDSMQRINDYVERELQDQLRLLPYAAYFLLIFVMGPIILWLVVQVWGRFYSKLIDLPLGP
ncbi:MAG: type II secretion system F family protein [Armatimonadota bacterium]